MSESPEPGPHHADDTSGDKVILVEIVAEKIPHDSPEFQERARQARQRPLPDYLQSKSVLDHEPPETPT